ncbi:hypothetical protein LJC47_01635 [Desulfosarcina sp. OttesenSCG-928-B08]|nr:hypothetical protein [Desulfosarcina sp. OttesenSCG-928-B08]
MAAKKRTLQVSFTAFFLGILLHLIMDTPVGGIAWAYPFSTHLYQWVVVPSRYGWWVWNFLLHWTFVFEILICIAGLVVVLRRKSTIVL